MARTLLGLGVLLTMATSAALAANKAACVPEIVGAKECFFAQLDGAAQQQAAAGGPDIGACAQQQMTKCITEKYKQRGVAPPEGLQESMPAVAGCITQVVTLSIPAVKQQMQACMLKKFDASELPVFDSSGRPGRKLIAGVETINQMAKYCPDVKTVCMPAALQAGVARLCAGKAACEKGHIKTPGCARHAKKVQRKKCRCFKRLEAANTISQQIGACVQKATGQPLPAKILRKVTRKIKKHFCKGSTMCR